MRISLGAVLAYARRRWGVAVISSGIFWKLKTAATRETKKQENDRKQGASRYVAAGRLLPG